MTRIGVFAGVFLNTFITHSLATSKLLNTGITTEYWLTISHHTFLFLWSILGGIKGVAKPCFNKELANRIIQNDFHFLEIETKSILFILAVLTGSNPGVPVVAVVMAATEGKSGSSKLMTSATVLGICESIT